MSSLSKLLISRAVALSLRAGTIGVSALRLKGGTHSCCAAEIPAVGKCLVRDCPQMRSEVGHATCSPCYNKYSYVFSGHTYPGLKCLGCADPFSMHPSGKGRAPWCLKEACKQRCKVDGCKQNCKNPAALTTPVTLDEQLFCEGHLKTAARAVGAPARRVWECKSACKTTNELTLECWKCGRSYRCNICNDRGLHLAEHCPKGSWTCLCWKGKKRLSMSVSKCSNCHAQRPESLSPRAAPVVEPAPAATVSPPAPSLRRHLTPRQAEAQAQKLPTPRPSARAYAVGDRLRIVIPNEKGKEGSGEVCTWETFRQRVGAGGVAPAAGCSPVFVHLDDGRYVWVPVATLARVGVDKRVDPNTPGSKEAYTRQEFFDYYTVPGEAGKRWANAGAYDKILVPTNKWGVYDQNEKLRQAHTGSVPTSKRYTKRSLGFLEEEEDEDRLRGSNPIIQFSNDDTATLAWSASEKGIKKEGIQIEKHADNAVAALSFANGECPGGVYAENRPGSQEEDLCRRFPYLYPSLKQHRQTDGHFGPWVAAMWQKLDDEGRPNDERFYSAKGRRKYFRCEHGNPMDLCKAKPCSEGRPKKSATERLMEKLGDELNETEALREIATTVIATPHCPLMRGVEDKDSGYKVTDHCPKMIVVSAAVPDLNGGHQKRDGAHSPSGYQGGFAHIREETFANALHAAANEGARTIVIGCGGTGHFGNSHEDIAAAWAGALTEHGYRFDQIIFSTYRKRLGERGIFEDALKSAGFQIGEW